MDKTCKQCGGKLPANRTRFCCEKCSYTWRNRNRILRPNVFYNCKECGKSVERYIEPSKQQAKYNTQEYCSRQCRGKYQSGDRHHAWKEGKWNSRGYTYVTAPDHPHCNHQGAVMEHRIIVEKHIGRYLTDEEVVHHIDGDPSNNELSNLRLFPTHAEHMAFHNSERARDSRGRYIRKK